MLLCRKIENEIGGINFITVNNRVLLFRKSLSTSVTVKRLYEKKKKKKNWTWKSSKNDFWQEKHIDCSINYTCTNKKYGLQNAMAGTSWWS